jgi:ribosomal protein S18 acetylase RimI-like enzyme
MAISYANSSHIPGLVALVNNAYRGGDTVKGWTNEAHLMEGPRTHEEDIDRLLFTPGGTLLIYEEAGDLLGSVYLEKQGNKLYLGMLSVSPEHQGAGIGKVLLAAARDHAVREGCDRIEITVISVREELIAWYERHGFKRTNEIRPFRHLALVVLERMT